MTYDNVFDAGNGLILKYSKKTIDEWCELCKIDLPYCNLPIDLISLTKYEKEIHQGCNSKILLPKYTDYKGFDSDYYTRKLTTKELLELFMYHSSLLNDMHQKGVYHLDVGAINCMINKAHDIKFIDMCEAVNINYKRKYTDVEKLDFKMNDKHFLFDMYVFYLANGNFSGLSCSFDDCGFPKELENEILEFYMTNDVTVDLDFYDLSNNLISLGYKSPKLEK